MILKCVNTFTLRIAIFFIFEAQKSYLNCHTVNRSDIALTVSFSRVVLVLISV